MNVAFLLRLGEEAVVALAASVVAVVAVDDPAAQVAIIGGLRAAYGLAVKRFGADNRPSVK